MPLVEIVVAALEGAWLYKEKEMMQVHAADCRALHPQLALKKRALARFFRSKTHAKSAAQIS